MEDVTFSSQLHQGAGQLRWRRPLSALTSLPLRSQREALLRALLSLLDAERGLGLPAPQVRQPELASLSDATAVAF